MTSSTVDRWTKPVIYNIGDKVEVWDGDVSRWVPGVVESIGAVGHVGMVTIATENRYEGLPLTYGVPVSSLGSLVRLRLLR